MPRDLDDNKVEDMASSAGPVLDDDGVGEMPENGNSPEPDAAASSPATGEDANSDDSYLSVVRDVVDKREPAEDEEGATASPAESEEDGESTDEDASKEEQDDEDYTDVPFHKHPRFQQLLRERNGFKDDAQRYQNVQTFIDQRGLQAEEAANLLVIGGLMKTNPAEAWARMKPTIQNLLIAAGEVLPDDLKQRVQKGEISQEMALEYSRLRAQTKSAETTRSFEQQRQEQQRAQQATTDLMDASAAWEADRRKKDPNFDAKYDSLIDKVYALQRRGEIPKTPAEVKAQLDKAYKAITPPVRGGQQRHRQQTQTNSGGQVAGNQRPAEQSTLDIIRSSRAAS